MKQWYKNFNFRKSTLEQIDIINSIVDEYIAENYVVTTRQLYYQLVARGYIENSLLSYKKTAQLINDGKLAGLIDWDALEDRTRSFISRSHWNNPAEILESAADSYHQDLWANQDNRVFVIIEKEALVGVLQRTCRERDIPLLAARGYPSGSVLREFAINQLIRATRNGQDCHIIHLGDHDPSGIDMSRDLEERLSLFTGMNVNLKRIALNMNQVEEIKPPENPAKVSDSRFQSYQQLYGESSWELDALSPTYLNDLLKKELNQLTDFNALEIVEEEIAGHRKRLFEIAEQFNAE